VNDEIKISLSDGSFVRLDDCMADDLSVVNAARISFKRISEDLTESDIGLINFLMKNRHGTPFEHSSFRFHVRAPIFVAREWFRHRAGWSYNEYSARYSKMEAEWFTPSPENIRTQIGKPGSYTFTRMPTHTSLESARIINQSNKNSYENYERLVEMGVAKELARTVLPVGMFTEFYATCNARSLMHFCTLRAAEEAQKEIRELAKAIEKIFSEIMPYTYNSYCNNGRQAP